MSVFDGTPLFEFPLDTVTIDPVKEGVWKGVEGNGSVLGNEGSLVVASLEFVVGVDGIGNLYGNVTDTTGIVGPASLVLKMGIFMSPLGS